MPTAGEGAGHTQLSDGLALGVETLSLNQTITFVQYTRVVLPLDGYVFWVNSSLLSTNALSFATGIYGRPISQAPATIKPLVVKGSFHYATEQKQNEDETIAINRVIFTALSEVQDFNDISPNLIYIGTFEGVRFAFNNRKSFYRQANLFHYTGDAIYPVMETQIIDDPADFNSSALIVSNSLPIWLAFQQQPQHPWQPNNPRIPVYPSFAVPDNLEPPYASVHIEPSSTMAIQATPRIDRTRSHFQLVSENVRFTLYGLDNNTALDFQDFLLQYSLDTDLFGTMGMPVMRDAKRTQSELNILAQKKTFELRVNYYQTRVQTLARQLILEAIPQIFIGG